MHMKRLVGRRRAGRTLALLCLASLPAIAGYQAATRTDSHAHEQRTRIQKRQQWFLRGRSVAGRPAAGERYRAYRQLLVRRAARRNSGLNAAENVAAAAAANTPGAWKPLGPTPLSSDASGIGQQDYGYVAGRATAIAIDPADIGGNTVFVGGAYGGVWKATNAGSLSPDPSAVEWRPLTDDQPSLAVGAIAVQPQLSNPNPASSVVLVGTGEANSSMDSYYGLGILRSTNGGASWATIIQQDSTHTHSFVGLGFSRILFSQDDPNRVVAAVGGTAQGGIEGLAPTGTSNLGLYYSTDAGSGWNYSVVTDNGTAISPGSATSVIYNTGARKFFAAIRFHGIYSSADGITWTRLGSQPGAGLSSASCPTSPASQVCPLYRAEMAAVPGRNEMYVWYVDAGENDQGIWKSNNGGASWTQISDTSITACGDVLGGCGTENGSYNLALAAVPNGATATDLYAGAVNLFKCRINSLSPGCAGPNLFLNLTHAYGCPPDFGEPAHVHPSQHAIDFLPINGGAQVVMYFSNDGGIYRALDGYSGLTSGSCDSPNQFSNLNQTLGSLTQFVSVAEDPANANAILGGAQGNGFPATAESLSNPGWRNVNFGDGGNVEINPSNPDEWFTSAGGAGVNLQRCPWGSSCVAQDFASGLVVSGPTLGGDAGPFYLPFILDPRDPGQLIVGTCRVWRGFSNGAGFSALSDNFDTGSPSICSGNETNLVRTLAAGGDRDSSGASKVIYAGTDGFGPSVPTVPAGGRIWSTVDSTAGASGWLDRTANINPNHYPVSSIAVDPSDTTGKTALVAIMGFHTPHVWKTQSGGASWNDHSGGLFDVPANALAVDPEDHIVYVGTDAGVFRRGTDPLNPNNPDWSEVGPASGAGFLPNVPVTALRIFNNGVTKILRAATYGRGLWQFVLSSKPDFQLAIPNPVQTAIGSQAAEFTGTLTAFNSYSSDVTLSCVANSTAPPKNCGPVPAHATPADAGTAFTLSANGDVGDYSFKIRGVGADQNAITRDLPLTLHVVDFGLSTPSPAAVTVNRSDSSPPIAFQVTAAGSFNLGVLLSCSGLPAGADCVFSPSTVVAPRRGAPVGVTLTIRASANVAPGNYPVVIDAAVAGGPHRTRNLSLTVISQPDFKLILDSTSASAVAGMIAGFTGTLTALNGYNSAVALSCGSGKPPTCSIVPENAVPTAVGIPFTVTVSSATAQKYSFPIVGQGSDSSSTAHSFPVTFNVVPFDFSLTANPSAATIQAGGTATFNLQVVPNAGVFLADVNLSWVNCPTLSTCRLSQPRIAAGSASASLSFSVTTTAPLQASLPFPRELYGFWLAGIGVVLFAGGRWKRKPILSCLLLMVLGLISCGSNNLTGNSVANVALPGTPPNSYKITITAATASLAAKTADISLKVQ